MEPRISIFACGHNKKMLNSVPKSPEFIKVDLTKLPIGNLQRNEFCESRLWLSNLPDLIKTDYAGQISANWNNKAYLNKLPTMDNLVEKINPLLEKSRTIVSYPTYTCWADSSESDHPGMGNLIKELCDKFNWEVANSGWSSSFFCSKEIWFEFLKRWRIAFTYIWTKYGTDLPFSVSNALIERKYALFLERLTMLTISNIPSNFIAI